MFFSSDYSWQLVVVWNKFWFYEKSVLCWRGSLVSPGRDKEELEENLLQSVLTNLPPIYSEEGGNLYLVTGVSFSGESHFFLLFSHLNHLQGVGICGASFCHEKAPTLLLGHWYEIMALYYIKSILTEISASRQDRRVLQKSKIIRIEFLSKWGMLQTSRYV